MGFAFSLDQVTDWVIDLPLMSGRGFRYIKVGAEALSRGIADGGAMVRSEYLKKYFCAARTVNHRRNDRRQKGSGHVAEMQYRFCARFPDWQAKAGRQLIRPAEPSFQLDEYMASPHKRRHDYICSCYAPRRPFLDCK